MTQTKNKPIYKKSISVHTELELIGIFRQVLRAYSYDRDRSYKHIDDIINEVFKTKRYKVD